MRVGVRISRESSARSRWLEPPRLRTAEEDAERHASWLELFFDLVFVVAIAQLSHELVLDHSLEGFLRFAGLFVPVWVAWQGFAFYADRFDTDDLVFRLAYLAAMVAIAALAVLVPDVAHGDSTAGFAISYVVLRSIMIALYLRAWVAVPAARTLIRFYATGYAVGVGVWLLSLAFDAPLRYVLWGIALVVDLSLPPLARRLHRRTPTTAGHAAERWGLFTIIVLGESVVVVALGTAGADWDARSVAVAVLGAAAIAGVWWLYFDRLESIVLARGTGAVLVYSYAHLPLLAGLAAAAGGLSLLIEQADDERLETGAAVAFGGGIAIFLVSLVAARVVTVAGPRRLGVGMKLGAAALVLAAVALSGALPPVALAALVALVLASLVVLERVLLPPPRWAAS